MKRLLLSALLTSLSLFAGTASAACSIVDATQEFWTLARESRGWSDTTQMAAFRGRVQAKHPGLYAPEVIDIDDPARLERKAVDALNEARASNFAAMSLIREMQNRLPAAIAKLQKRFPDFRCDFPIYLMVSLDQFDGAGRVVDGQPALVFGVDAIQALDTGSRLSVFLMHELFHRYHAQAAGFSDDPGADQEIWRALWAEGLATYVSAAFNLENSLADALMLPRDLEQQARPMLPKLAAELRASADKIDRDLFGRFFEYGNKSAKESGLPWRSAYYLGYRVAALANERCSIETLVHWDAATVRQEVDRDLALLAGKDWSGLAPPCSVLPRR
ncbi:MAG: hypothetical protein JWM77_864 [Rhodospirillales bacterium]|nr:hypothetical protein [Rhodospirillales bacterium]